MTLPLDTTPLRDAVVAALTTATGKPRSLGLVAQAPGGKQFFSEVFAEPSQGESLSGPVCRVELHGHGGDPGGSPLEGGDRRRESVTVEITTWHPASWGDSKSARSSRVIAERDKQRVIGALTESGALGLDPDGNDTGADDGCLRWDSYSSAGPKFPLRKSDPRIALTTHVFRTTVELLKPT